MKVLFLQDVPHVARAGDIKEVASGYGRNFLIPKNLAALATPGALKSAEKQLAEIARKRQEAEAELTEVAHALEAKELTIKAKTGGSDRLYGSITAADIAGELQKISPVEIDKRKIELEKPIRQLGSHEVVVRLAKDISATIKVTVIGEKTEPDKEPEVTVIGEKTEPDAEPEVTAVGEKTEPDAEPEVTAVVEETEPDAEPEVTPS